MFVLLLRTVLLRPHQDLWLCDLLCDAWHEQPLNEVMEALDPKYSYSVPFPSSSWYKSSQYPFHLSAIYAASVKTFRQSLTGYIADVAGTFESVI